VNISKTPFGTDLAVALLQRLAAVADGEVAADGDGASRNVVVVGQRDGVNVREVGGVEDEQFVGRASHRGAACYHHAIGFLADRHPERLNLQLFLLVLTANAG